MDARVIKISRQKNRSEKLARPRKGVALHRLKWHEAVARPRKVARRSGIPKRVRVICSLTSARALRASRSSQDKR